MDKVKINYYTSNNNNKLNNIKKLYNEYKTSYINNGSTEKTNVLLINLLQYIEKIDK